MFRTFNMGIGMVLAIDKSEVTKMTEMDSATREIGTIIEGDGVKII